MAKHTLRQNQRSKLRKSLACAPKPADQALSFLRKTSTMQSSRVDRSVAHWSAKQSFDRQTPKPFVLLAAVVVGLSLAGCHKKPQEKQADVSGQDVAQVGAEPITTSELQLEAKNNNPRQAPTDQDNARALQHIAARKTLAQRAIAQGLDRQPLVLLEIRRAREQILAEAVAIEAAKADEKKLSLETINAFIAAHPYQFGKRAVLQVNEILIPHSKDLEKIVADVKDATKLDQISSYLDQNKIAHQQRDIELDTATIADPLVNALQKGNTIPVIKTPAAAVFMQMTQSRPEPITATAAEKLARNVMTRNFYENELAAPGPDAAVTYSEPYNAIIAKQKSSGSQVGSGTIQSAPSGQDAASSTTRKPPLDLSKSSNDTANSGGSAVPK